MAPANLLIFGASARAAAFSALRAGLEPWCVDLFADADLSARCFVHPLPSEAYPDGFAEVAGWGPPGPWMYTGGLENSPDLVESIDAQRPLWGNPAHTLRQVRDPGYLAFILERWGLPFPELRLRLGSDLEPGRWLAKPWAGAGGSGIHFVTENTSTREKRRQLYYQKFIEGDSCGVLYLGEERRAWLLGITHQLIGEAWLHAPPFRYCGSIGPVSPDVALKDRLQRLGTALVQDFRLRGLFGVDCIFRDDVPYPVEVNPRYTASVEIWEYGTSIPALALHRRVFEPGSPEPILAEQIPSRCLVGKAILFARQAMTFPADGPWMTTLRQPGDIWALPAFADIPAAGTPIKAGRPVLTFFARGQTIEGCREDLQRIAAELDHFLYSCG